MNTNLSLHASDLAIGVRALIDLELQGLDDAAANAAGELLADAEQLVEMLREHKAACELNRARQQFDLPPQLALQHQQAMSL
jgi:hypothetical protein